MIALCQCLPLGALWEGTKNRGEGYRRKGGTPPSKMQASTFELIDGTAAVFAGLTARYLIVDLLSPCSFSVSILFRA